MRLEIWSEATSKTFAEIAILIGKPASNVHGYMYGVVIPRQDIMEKIAYVTCGAVTANDFYNITVEKIEKYWEEENKKKDN